MSSRRFALLIANLEYRSDSLLKNLVSPSNDIIDLKKVLVDKNVGDFEVLTLVNQTSYESLETIEKFLVDRKSDETALLYISGHGIKDIDGKLYFATINTRRSVLYSTAIKAKDIADLMERSRAGKKLIILDTCFSGAFVRGMQMKADMSVNVSDHFDGRGYGVLTSSDETQYSFEGDNLLGNANRSYFTQEIVNGLKSGEADKNADGEITLNEIFEYVEEKFTFKGIYYQKPKKWEFGVQGKIILAHNSQVLYLNRELKQLDSEKKERLAKEEAAKKTRLEQERLDAEKKEKERLAKEDAAKKTHLEQELLDRKKHIKREKPFIMQAVNTTPVLISIGVLLFLCICSGFFWWVDATYRWCTFFPFVSGC